MNIRLKVIFAFLSVVFLGSCAVADLDTTADFTRLKTFNWGKSEVQVGNPLYRSDLIDRRITMAVESEFLKRGIHRDDRHADFQVTYTTYTEQKERRRSSSYYGYPAFFPYRFGFFPYMYGPLPYGGFPIMEAYTEGTLIIDIRDNHTDKLVWRGSVTGDIGKSNNVEKLIQKGVKAIIRKYPIKEGMDKRVKDASVIS